MIVFLKAEQFGLFDVPTLVHGSVSKTGVVTAPHVRMQKKRLDVHAHKPAHAAIAEPDLFAEPQPIEPAPAQLAAKQPEPAPAPAPLTLEDMVAKLGKDRIAQVMERGTPDEKETLIGLIANAVGKPHKEARAALESMFPIALVPVPSESTLVEHVTGRGKTLRGVIASDWSKDEAMLVDPYTFKKDGGWFVREKHLIDGQLPPLPLPSPVNPTSPASFAAPREPEPEPAPAARSVDLEQPFDAAAAPAWGVSAGVTQSQRKEYNRQAQAIVANGGPQDAAERQLLTMYSGNGGIGDSLNEYYTDPKVAAAMWRVLRQLGLKENATVLEPSCATGVFLETAPAAATVTGVELDPVSAKIGQALHGAKHEVLNSSLERFATQDGRQFDAVIGNAPFGLRGSMLADDKRHLKTAEAYFLDTSLDKCKSGGIVAMIVPTGVMDGKNNRGLRERLLRKGEFLGAQRMPNTAFEHGHTEVTTDIVYLRKRPEDVAAALERVEQADLQRIGVWDADFLAGKYFTTRGAPNIFGKQEAGWRAKAGIGSDITVNGSMEGVPDAIAEFEPDSRAQGPADMPKLLELFQESDHPQLMANSRRRAYTAAKPGDVRTIDGVAYVLQGDPPRWHRVEDVAATSGMADAARLATQIGQLIQAHEEGEETDHKPVMQALEDWVKAHGIPSKNPELLLAAKSDKSLYRLIGSVDPTGKFSDIVSGRAPRKLAGDFDTVAQGLALQKGSFTAGDLAAKLGRKDADTVLDELYASADYALLPDSSWTTMNQFASGDLWLRYDAMKKVLDNDKLPPEQQRKFSSQLEAIEQAIDPKSLEDVEVELNSAFLPLYVLEAFQNHKRDEYLEKSPGAISWLTPTEITLDHAMYKVHGGLNVDLLERYLNRNRVQKKELPTIEEWNQEFKEWLCTSEYRDSVEALYNRKFRGYRPEVFSDETMDIPGMVTAGLKQYQYGGLRWALQRGKGIVAADVGLGKTVRGLMLARMAKITGQAKCPALTVPKSVLANWVSEANRWFPGSRIMVIGETYSTDKDGELKGVTDSPDVRNRKLHELTQNDYDFVLFSAPAFEDIDINPIMKEEYAQRDFFDQRAAALKNAGDKKRNKIREAYNQALANRDIGKRTDAIYFDDLPIDMLIIDEGHAYKNLFKAKNRYGESPKFLGGQGESQRAMDMHFKSMHILEKSGGKNMYMLTATPTKNSPLEVYSMLSYIAPEAFERIGIRNSEEFLDRFCVFDTDTIYTLSGGFEPDTLVTTGFKNLDELREIMSRYIDRKTAEDVGLVLPTRDDKMHFLEMSDMQRSVYNGLRAELAESQKDGDATGDAHIFSIMNRMRLAALDLELLDPHLYKGQKSPKYEELAKNVKAMWEGEKGSQVIFADAVDAHEKIRDSLIALGIPKHKIAIVNAEVAKTSMQRQNIAEGFNNGKYDFVIGNTDVMGEGMNLQKRTTDIHHLDIPWNAAIMQQRNGRGLRQGNINESMRIHTYLSRGTFDGYRWQSMNAKKDWQDLLWHGGDKVENLNKEGGPVSKDEMMIMLAEDPEAARVAMSENKAAVTERYDAQQRASLVHEFSRFATLRSSYAKVKDKSSPSALRLKTAMDRTKSALQANKYLVDKDVLEHAGAAIINPNTGKALMVGRGVERMDEASQPEKLVITGVDTSTGTLKCRAYGVPDAPSIYVSRDEHQGLTDFAYDPVEEGHIIARKVDEQIKDGSLNASSPSELRKVPHHVLTELYPTLQQHLKERAKSWNYATRASGFAMVKDGKPYIAKTGEARKVLDSADIMLPTPEHRALAIQGYIDRQNDRELKQDYTASNSSRSGHGYNIPSPVKITTSYGMNGGGYRDEHKNPWIDAGKELFGSEFEEEAHQAYMQHALAAANKATDLKGVISALAPTMKVEYGKYTWPKESLAYMYRRAQEHGALHPDALRSDHIPMLTKYQSEEAPLLGNSKSSLSTLLRLAFMSGHHDLAAAMVVAAKDIPAKTKADALDQLLVGIDSGTRNPLVGAVKAGHRQAMAVLEGMRHLLKNDDGSLDVHDILETSISHQFPNLKGTLGERIDSAIKKYNAGGEA
jgi:SNF2 family DNA or RNA helicase/predicted RNA methylase